MVMLLLGVAVSVQRVDTLTLDQAMTRALAERPRTRVAAGVTARARGSSRILGQVPNPTLQLDRYDAPPDRKIYLTQSLNWLLRRGADRATGRAIVERGQADSVAMVAELAREVRHAFIAALAGREGLALAMDQRRLADSLLIIAERRLSLGDIAGFERDQVAQAVEVARQVESVALEAEQVAALHLRRAIGGSNQRTVAPSGALDQDGGAATALDSLSIPPALVVALADSAEAAGRLRSARLAQVPPLSVRAGQEAGGGFAAKAFVGFSLAIPIFSRGREAVAEAVGANTVAEGTAAEARLELEVRVAEARVRLEQAQSRAVRARDALVPSAQRLRAGAVRLYQLGQTSILPVFDAMRAERDVVRGMIDAWVAYQNARADLLALFGQGT